MLSLDKYKEAYGNEPIEYVSLSEQANEHDILMS